MALHQEKNKKADVIKLAPTMVDYLYVKSVFYLRRFILNEVGFYPTFWFSGILRRDILAEWGIILSS